MMSKLSYFDANLYVGSWPFHKLKYNDIDGVLHLMDRAKIERGIISSLDSLFCIDRDLAVVNEQLYESTKAYPDKFFPFYTVHPYVLESCEYVEMLKETRNLRGIRLHPSYHDYSLASDRVSRLCEKAEQLKVPVFITYRFEDDRVHHPKAMVPPVKMEELVELFNGHSGTSFIVGGMRITEAGELKSRLQQDNVFFELSFIQTPFRSLELLAETVGVHRVLFGSGLPYWYPECATLKAETSILSTAELEQITKENAIKLLDVH